MRVPRNRTLPTGRAAMFLAATSLVIASGCSDEEEALEAPPAGTQWVEHPDAVVAVPEDWVPIDDGQVPHLRADDPDAVQFAAPDAPGGKAVGVVLWRYGDEDGFVQQPMSELVATLYGTGGFEQHRRDEFDVPGAEEGAIIQASFDGTALDGDPTVHATFVSALSDRGFMVLSIYGTEDGVSPEAVEQALETFRMTGG